MVMASWLFKIYGLRCGCELVSAKFIRASVSCRGVYLGGFSMLTKPPSQADRRILAGS